MAKKFKISKKEAFKTIGEFNDVAEDLDLDKIEIDEDDYEKTFEDFVESIDELDEDELGELSKNIFELFDGLVECETGDATLELVEEEKKGRKKDRKKDRKKKEKDEEKVDDTDDEVTLEKLRDLDLNELIEFAEEAEIKLGKAKKEEAIIKKICKSLKIDYVKEGAPTEEVKKEEKVEKKRAAKEEDVHAEDPFKESVSTTIFEIVVADPSITNEELVAALEDQKLPVEGNESYIKKYLEISKAFYVIAKSVLETV